MAVNTREYVTSLTLSRSDIQTIQDFQLAVIEKGFKAKNLELLKNALGPCSTVFGVMSYIAASGALGIASAVLAVVSGLTSPSQESSIAFLMDKGYIALGSLDKQMREGNWQMVKIDLPFIEFVDQKIRLVSGYGLYKLTIKMVFG